MLCEMGKTVQCDIIAMELEFVVIMTLLLIGKQITIVPIQWVNLISLCDGRRLEHTLVHSVETYIRFVREQSTMEQ